MPVLAHGVAPAAGRIGPNAIIRPMHALVDELGESDTRALLVRAGLDRYIDALPTEMVNEDDVTALFRAITIELGPSPAAAIGRTAGRATGDYLLANRIPLVARVVLRLLPAPLASRSLLRAIGLHTWTFAGTGAVRITPGNPCRIVIKGCPICRGRLAHQPSCDYYAATFERLFRALVKPTATAREVECAATGGPACNFEVHW